MLGKFWRGLMALTLGRLLKWTIGIGATVLIAIIAGFAAFILIPNDNIPAAEPIDDYVFLDQGWGSQAQSEPRQLYYYTGQGTSTVREARIKEASAARNKKGFEV